MEILPGSEPAYEPDCHVEAVEPPAIARCELVLADLRATGAQPIDQLVAVGLHDPRERLAELGEPLVKPERRGAAQVGEVARTHLLEDRVGPLEECPLRPRVRDLKPDDLRRGRAPPLDHLRIGSHSYQEPLLALAGRSFELS